MDLCPRWFPFSDCPFSLLSVCLLRSSFHNDAGHKGMPKLEHNFSSFLAFWMAEKCKWYSEKKVWKNVFHPLKLLFLHWGKVSVQGTVPFSPCSFGAGEVASCFEHLSVGHCANCSFGWGALSFIDRSACALGFVPHLFSAAQGPDGKITFPCQFSSIFFFGAPFKASFTWLFNTLVSQNWKWPGRWHFLEDIRVLYSK